MYFAIGDYLAGMLTGVLTALGVRAVVSTGMDMVVAMMIGMAVGMTTHLGVGILLTPLLGMFEPMIPGVVIGMYGGMMFGMRDSMGAGSHTLGAAALVGALFGTIVVAGISMKRIAKSWMRGLSRSRSPVLPPSVVARDLERSTSMLSRASRSGGVLEASADPTAGL